MLRLVNAASCCSLDDRAYNGRFRECGFLGTEYTGRKLTWRLTSYLPEACFFDLPA